ncbi:MAG: Fpg/Nei family DNA glycosylase [Streptosporangiaceae bacterium]
MPELPEVEALARFLADRAVGHTVTRVDVVAVSVLKTYSPPVTSLGGLAVGRVTRRGKFLDLDVGGGDASGGAGLHLILHLARAGWLRWRDELPAKPPRPGKGPLALRVHLDEGGLDITEAGTQKRLAAYVVRDPFDVPGIARLGPDPMDPAFTTAVLARLLEGRRTRIKGVLRDQTAIAGIGNAYSDEILHVARFSPYKLAADMSPGEIEALHCAIVDTLGQAAERANGLGVGSIKDDKQAALRVHGRTGEECRVCGDTIREVSFADSSLQYCPTCQTGGHPLADRRMSRLLK